jgi:uncharacterized protein (DUF983 family)
MSQIEENELVDVKAIEHMKFPGVSDQILGRCNCGEGKRYALFYLNNKLHRKCRSCGDIVDMEG